MKNDAPSSVIDSYYLSKDSLEKAKLALVENDRFLAKRHLDQAFKYYSDTAPLHKAYRDYYIGNGNLELAQLAQARFQLMVNKAITLNDKSQVAIEQLDNFDLAKDILSLSLRYNDEDPTSLINMGSIAYAMGDSEVSKNVVEQLHAIKHRSPSFTFLQLLLAEAINDSISQLALRNELAVLYPDSVEYRFIKKGRTDLHDFVDLKFKYLESNHAERNATATEIKVEFVNAESSNTSILIPK